QRRLAVTFGGDSADAGEHVAGGVRGGREAEAFQALAYVGADRALLAGDAGDAGQRDQRRRDALLQAACLPVMRPLTLRHLSFRSPLLRLANRWFAIFAGTPAPPRRKV